MGLFDKLTKKMVDQAMEMAEAMTGAVGDPAQITDGIDGIGTVAEAPVIEDRASIYMQPVAMVGAVRVPMAVMMVVGHGTTVATPPLASEIAICPSGAGHLIHNSYRFPTNARPVQHALGRATDHQEIGVIAGVFSLSVVRRTRGTRRQPPTRHPRKPEV